MSTEEQSTENKGIESISAFYDQNKNNFFIAGIALILVAGGIYYYNSFYKPGVEMDANNALYKAERAFNQDSLDLALNGAGETMGMMDVAGEYSSTAAGSQAAYYAGVILLEQGKFEEALEYLEDADMNDELMAAQLITLQGDCYSELEKYEDAADTYMKAANKRTNDLTTPYALLKAGIAYEEAGSYDDAMDAFERIQKDYSNSPQGQKIETRIARVEARASL